MEYGLPDLVEIELGGETFRGQPLDAPEVERLVRRHTTSKMVKGQLVERFNAVDFGRELFERTVAEWEGPQHNREPWPCSTENKRELYDRHTERAKQVLDAFDQKVAEIREGRAGN